MLQIWKLWLSNLQDLGHYLIKLCPFWKAGNKEKELKLFCVVWLLAILWEGGTLESLRQLGDTVSPSFEIYTILSQNYPFSVCSVLDCWGKSVECLKITTAGSTLKGWGWKMGIAEYPAESQTPAVPPHTLRGILDADCGECTASRGQGILE